MGKVRLAWPVSLMLKNDIRIRIGIQRNYIELGKTLLPSCFVQKLNSLEKENNNVHHDDYYNYDNKINTNNWAIDFTQCYQIFTCKEMFDINNSIIKFIEGLLNMSFCIKHNLFILKMKHQFILPKYLVFQNTLWIVFKIKLLI